MKKVIFALLSYVLMTVVVAQPKGNFKKNREQIRAAKIAYITQNVGLTEKQSEDFWPVYNEYAKKRRGVRKEIRSIQKTKGTNIDQLSDQEAQKSIEEVFSLREKGLQIDKEYKDKLLNVISPKQLAKLYKSEKDFMKMLHKKVRERRAGGQHPSPGDMHSPEDFDY